MIGIDLSDEEVAAEIIKFLVSGVCSDCQLFREDCFKVLKSLGTDATYDLRHIASHASMMPGHRRRFEALIDSLDDATYQRVNPIPGLFRAVLALIKTSHLDVDVIRGVSSVAELIGRPIIACVLMDELCDHFRDRPYARRLIDAIASISLALSPRHRDYLQQIAVHGPREVEWRCKKLLSWIGESGSGSSGHSYDDSDADCRGLKLLDWLERAAVLGPDTRVTDPDWIWLRDFRYRPQIVNHGPILAYCRY